MPGFPLSSVAGRPRGAEPLPAGSATALRRLTVALCVLAAVRMLVVVAPLPMRGYANNYDFIRVSAWFDLWPIAPGGVAGFDPLAQHPSAPLRCYRVDPGVTSDVRYPTTELGFVWLALRANDAWRALAGPSRCEFDLRVLGLLRMAILMGAGVLTTIAFFRRSPGAGVASALLLALVLSDPAVVLLLNTLYSEFSTILLAYLACAQIVYALGFAAFGLASGLLLGATMLALAFTKTQYAGLSLALVAVLAAGAVLTRDGATRRRQRGRTVVIAALGAITGLVLQQRLLGGGGYMWAMRMGAATDTFFGAVLPLHSDPDRALGILGLPERCRQYVGRTWYDEGMQPPPCPEIASVSRLRILQLLADDPGLGVRLARRALPMLQPLVVRYYGQVEAADRAQADERWRSGIISVSVLLEALPAGIFAMLVAMTILAGAVALIDLARGRTAALLPSLVLVCCVVEIYSFASSLFGAGFIGLARHSLAGQLAFLVLLAPGPLLLARAIQRRVGTRRGDRRARTGSA